MLEQLQVQKGFQQGSASNAFMQIHNDISWGVGGLLNKEEVHKLLILFVLLHNPVWQETIANTASFT